MAGEEGWYVDPYGVHQARWISAGTPTALVRDGGVESQDPPPSAPFEGELQELEETESPDGEDLLRADSAEAQTFDPEASEEAVWDTFGESSGGD
jgi:hypothetical protein